MRQGTKPEPLQPRRDSAPKVQPPQAELEQNAHQLQQGTISQMVKWWAKEVHDHWPHSGSPVGGRVSRTGHHAFAVQTQLCYLPFPPGMTGEGMGRIGRGGGV